MLLYTVFVLFVSFLNLRTISKYKPTGVIWRGDLTEVFLHFLFGGAYTCRGNVWSFMVDLKMRE